MTTVSQLYTRVGRMLGDVGFDGYDEGLFYDAFSSALDAILPWVPKRAQMTITGTGASLYQLPSDLYEAEGVIVDSTGEILPRAMLIPGYFIGETLQGVNDWIEYPYGYISFSKDVSVGETYTLYYLAHWDKPVDESDLVNTIEAPDYTVTALTLYTTAYMLYPSAVSAAEVRQFNTKVDSGNPEHNPMQQAATYLMRLFIDEMNRHPRHQKAQK